ncbi:MAG: FAD-dependent oxidoreductase [Deltaproteobacteria bacterium]|jgi:NADPH-dependent 2,4-dienoyl-CoA reductase/sulfur reductase-like enzyme/Fe-S-cluster-containing hydrogenase component 2/bacterioferritin-associated ferredoxin|nr:FAD-dependent oxidoreductase [Deltaproteobacteria bacterium]MBW2537511.1 FAD-dependent oxidoreductase [Deltaproteobacteria bacterium]
MSDQRRIQHHPILEPLPPATVPFTFNDRPLVARPGEMVSSALYAAGIAVFGHHHRDGGAQGIFCVNGQCSQCTVLADGRPVKSCMTAVTEGMVVRSLDGAATLPAEDGLTPLGRPGERRTTVLILGGGPAGLCAAVELGRAGIDVLVVDDKPELGGKLTLQTHQFFGSVADCWAGTRGIDIARILAAEIERLPSVEVWLDSTAVGVFCDDRVGVVTPSGYRLVQADALLVALGAREKSLSFPGCDLPGVYGAGAFQTLVNRDLVRSSERLFVLGGGNVGLIGAYHALQAGIDVVGLVEALPEVGGYKVHADKIRRLGVPIWTSHTVVRAEPGADDERLARVTIAEIDGQFEPVSGTERTFAVDTLLIAVGLNSCDELFVKSRELGLKVYSAGDAAEIAEASAAIFSGRIVGRQIAGDLGVPVTIPADWPDIAAMLRSRPGRTVPFEPPELPQSVYPVIRCVQEIPCDPCQAVCPEGSITLGGSIMNLPSFSGTCLGCGECVSICPGLAINLVIEDYDGTGERALLLLPFELGLDRVPLGVEVETVDLEGRPVGTGRVVAVRQRPEQDRRHLLLVDVPKAERLQVAGFRMRPPSQAIAAGAEAALDDPQDPMVCRCERVPKSAIVREIRQGVRNLNQLKALARVSMGGCGGKTCTDLVKRIFREEGVDLAELTPGTTRPLVAETPLSAFVRGDEEDRG